MSTQGLCFGFVLPARQPLQGFDSGQGTLPRMSFVTTDHQDLGLQPWRDSVASVLTGTPLVLSDRVPVVVSTTRLYRTVSVLRGLYHGYGATRHAHTLIEPTAGLVRRR
jgi:hypothetical protein